MKQTVMSDHIDIPRPLSTKDKEVYKFGKMIILERRPLNSVENNNYRDVLKVEYPFCKQLLIKVLLQMTIEIEELISLEMNDVPGGGMIIHDG